MDVFAKGKPVYFFQNFDVKNKLPLDDETYIIILNTKCNPKLVPERLKPLYAYINDRVQQYNSTEWRRVQVTLEHMLLDKEKRAIEKGRAEGRKRRGLSESAI